MVWMWPTPMARWVASFTSASVSGSSVPGGSSRLTCVCALLSAGMKPEGSSGMSASDPAKNSSASTSVVKRWCRHQPTACM